MRQHRKTVRWRGCFSGVAILGSVLSRKTPPIGLRSWRPCAIFMVSRLGARLGNHTSYQFFAVKSAFGTSRGRSSDRPDGALPSPGDLSGAESNNANGHESSTVQVRP